MVLWDTSPPSSWSAGFLNKVAIPCPNTLSLDLLTCRGVSSRKLNSVTVWRELVQVVAARRLTGSRFVHLPSDHSRPYEMTVCSGSPLRSYQDKGLELMHKSKVHRAIPGLITKTSSIEGESSHFGIWCTFPFSPRLLFMFAFLMTPSSLDRQEKRWDLTS